MSEPEMEKTTEDCREISQCFSAILDGELNGEDRARVDKHLLSCTTCSREYELWQRISQTLKEEALVREPSPGFAAGVVARLETQRRNRFIRPDFWRTPAAAAVAAVMLFSGSWGVSVALNSDQPDTVVVQQEQQGEKPSQLASNIDGRPSAEELQNPQAAVAAEKESKAPSVATRQTSRAKPVQVFSGVTLLSNNEKDVLSSILKLSVADIDSARERVLSLAGQQGSHQTLVSRSDLVIIRVNVSRASGETVLARLSALGQVTSRGDEVKNISDAYNRALARLNEIQYALNQNSPDKAQLEAEASALTRQIEAWNSEASTYGIIVWLQS